MVKKILAPTDGSDHAGKAIAYAVDLASKYGATLCLLHVVSTPPALFHEGAFALPDVQQSLEEEGRRIIEEAEKEAKQQGAGNVQSLVVHGNPASEIIKLASAEGIDLIIMGSRGLTAIKEFVLGSVSHRVSHLAECTVTIVK